MDLTPMFDKPTLLAIGQVVVLLVAWKGWPPLVEWLTNRKGPNGHTNGFTRGDAVTLAVLGERVDHLTDSVGREGDAQGVKLDKLTNDVARMDNMVGRLVTVLEINNALKRPD